MESIGFNIKRRLVGMYWMYSSMLHWGSFWAHSPREYRKVPYSATKAVSKSTVYKKTNFRNKPERGYQNILKFRSLNKHGRDVSCLLNTGAALSPISTKLERKVDLTILSAIKMITEADGSMTTCHGAAKNIRSNQGSWKQRWTF